MPSTKVPSWGIRHPPLREVISLYCEGALTEDELWTSVSERPRFGRRAPSDRQANLRRLLFSRSVKGEPCARCGSGKRITAHHVIALRYLKGSLLPRSALYDPRNAMPLCSPCHL